MSLLPTLALLTASARAETTSLIQASDVTAAVAAAGGWQVLPGELDSYFEASAQRYRRIDAADLPSDWLDAFDYDTSMQIDVVHISNADFGIASSGACGDDDADALDTALRALADEAVTEDASDGTRHPVLVLFSSGTFCTDGSSFERTRGSDWDGRGWVLADDMHLVGEGMGSTELRLNSVREVDENPNLTNRPDHYKGAVIESVDSGVTAASVTGLTANAAFDVFLDDSSYAHTLSKGGRSYPVMKTWGVKLHGFRTLVDSVEVVNTANTVYYNNKSPDELFLIVTRGVAVEPPWKREGLSQPSRRSDASQQANTDFDFYLDRRDEQGDRTSAARRGMFAEEHTAYGQVLRSYVHQHWGGYATAIQVSAWSNYQPVGQGNVCWDYTDGDVSIEQGDSFSGVSFLSPQALLADERALVDGWCNQGSNGVFHVGSWPVKSRGRMVGNTIDYGDVDPSVVHADFTNATDGQFVDYYRDVEARFGLNIGGGTLDLEVRDNTVYGAWRGLNNDTGGYSIGQGANGWESFVGAFDQPGELLRTNVYPVVEDNAFVDAHYGLYIAASWEPAVIDNHIELRPTRSWMEGVGVWFRPRNPVASGAGINEAGVHGGLLQDNSVGYAKRSGTATDGTPDNLLKLVSELNENVPGGFTMASTDLSNISGNTSYSLTSATGNNEQGLAAPFAPWVTEGDSRIYVVLAYDSTGAWRCFDAVPAWSDGGYERYTEAVHGQGICQSSQLSTDPLVLADGGSLGLYVYAVDADDGYVVRDVTVWVDALRDNVFTADEVVTTGSETSGSVFTVATVSGCSDGLDNDGDGSRDDGDTECANASGDTADRQFTVRVAVAPANPQVDVAGTCTSDSTASIDDAFAYADGWGFDSCFSGDVLDFPITIRQTETSRD